MKNRVKLKKKKLNMREVAILESEFGKSIL